MCTEDDYRSLNYFGKILVEQFKDERLDWFGLICKGEEKGGSIKGLQDKVKILDQDTKNLIAACLTDAIIDGLHDFLFSINVENDFDKRIQIFVDGKNIADISEQLNWEVLGEDGWEAKYSKYPTSNAIYDAYNKGEVPKIISE